MAVLLMKNGKAFRLLSSFRMSMLVVYYLKNIIEIDKVLPY
ncbi:hypothetical protein [Chryseobacterium arachidis]|nr:hypothetical protein [Chryseobacterium arachidis]